MKFKNTKRCPHCGADEAIATYTTREEHGEEHGFAVVQCKSCGMQGPIVKDYRGFEPNDCMEWAIDKWNALPRSRRRT